MTPRVLDIHCACDNHNLCPRCGQPLAEARLSAYGYERKGDRVWYLAAYAGLSHVCSPATEPMSA